VWEGCLESGIEYIKNAEVFHKLFKKIEWFSKQKELNPAKI